MKIYRFEIFLIHYSIISEKIKKKKLMRNLKNSN